MTETSRQHFDRHHPLIDAILHRASLLQTGVPVFVYFQDVGDWHPTNILISCSSSGSSPRAQAAKGRIVRKLLEQHGYEYAGTSPGPHGDTESEFYVRPADPNDQSPVDPIEPSSIEDCEVVERDVHCDAEHAANFRLPWLVLLPDGAVLQYASEDDACRFQRSWRLGAGLHTTTGEPIEDDAMEMERFFGRIGVVYLPGVLWPVSEAEGYIKFMSEGGHLDQSQCDQFVAFLEAHGVAYERFTERSLRVDPAFLAGVLPK